MENKEKDFDPEFTGYLKKMAKNLVKDVEHLKAFLDGKDESYILCNPEEVASELINSGMTAAHIMGAYNTLYVIRETGMVPEIMFDDEEAKK